MGDPLRQPHSLGACAVSEPVWITCNTASELYLGGHCKPQPEKREHALNGYRAAVRDVDAVHGRHGGDGAAGRVLMTETLLKVITLTALVAMWVPILDALPFVMLLLSIITVMAIAVLLSR